MTLGDPSGQSGITVLPAVFRSPLAPSAISFLPVLRRSWTSPAHPLRPRAARLLERRDLEALRDIGREFEVPDRDDAAVRPVEENHPTHGAGRVGRIAAQERRAAVRQARD